jgi:hypothetical protein
MELIFSMIIIAVAFIVFPKVIQMSAKSGTYTLKEEAMYNALALVGLMKNLPWDEKNSDYDDILLTNGDAAYECAYAFADSASIYRKGSFVGSRNCRHKLNASATLGLEEASVDEADDLDDFAAYSVVAENRTGTRRYRLEASVRYIRDLAPSEQLFSTAASADMTNLKYVEVNATPLTKAKDLEGLAKFWYISSNIGQLRIFSAPWSGR